MKVVNLSRDRKVVYDSLNTDIRDLFLPVFS